MVIGFDPVAYSIGESEGQVDVMIRVLDGQLYKTVTVTLNTLGHGLVGEISGNDHILHSLLYHCNEPDIV